MREKYLAQACKCGTCGEVEHDGKTESRLIVGDLYFCEVCGTVEKSVSLGEERTGYYGEKYTHVGKPVKTIKDALEAIAAEYKEVITEKHLMELQKVFEVEDGRVVVHERLTLNRILNELHELSKPQEIKKS